MAISSDERRFLKAWEEQRREGKGSYVRVYTFGLFILYYMAFLAVGLFSGWPFIKVSWLVVMGVVALAGAIGTSLFLWHFQQKKFAAIIQRELLKAEELAANL